MEAIVHEGFSENFQVKHQIVVMAAHWSNEMATLFTAVVYHVICSFFWWASQDKVNAYAFNSANLEKVKEVTSVKTVLYRSDGAGSQLKNCYNLASLLYHKEDFNCKDTWNFFETVHGKGPVDGVGGEVKRSVWWAILQGNTVVTNAENFF